MSSNDFPELEINFLSHPELSKLVARDYEELRKLIPSNTPKSVLVLSGSIIEGALSDALISSGKYDIKSVNKLTFVEIIENAKALGVIRKTELSSVLRVYRNLVHPAREVIDQVEFDGADATLARAAVDVVLKELRTWSLFSHAIKQITENEALLLKIFADPPTPTSV
ncbi:MAG: hypothetical protein KA831_03245 [Pyrinomonadaceae bacterium]|nr:hypothetical protein [Acidobacteriota bacterium]MBP7415645.1 hypothetical protein [Pyrinomonadaceae bacterium]